jgi:peptidoglycan/LPS O-acetylase OafA/YrhL
VGIIRLLLALSVVLNHTEPLFGFSLIGGKVAVQTFFIVSGFYMTMILNEKYIKENNSYWLFLTNRLMRLFPVYWVVLALTVFFSIILGAFINELPVFDVYGRYLHNMNLSTFAFLVLTNILLFGQDVVMFLGLDISTGDLFFTKDFRQSDPMLYNFLFIPQAWTIGLELMFYLIAPFLLRRKLWVIVSLILVSLGLRLFMHSQGLTNDPWTYRFFPSELAFFLLGTLSYHLYRRVSAMKVSSFLSYSSLFFLLSFILSYSFLPRWFEFNLFFLPFDRKELLFFTSITVLLPLIFQLSKRWKVDSYIGELSYPIYISHMLVLMAVTKLNLHLSFGLGVPVVLGTLVLSVGLNELVAKKVEVVRQRRVRTVDNKADIKRAKVAL